jgi:hypothetical protein
MNLNLRLHADQLRNYSLFFALLFVGSKLTAQTGATIFSDHFNRASLGSFWHTPTSWTIQNGAAYVLDGAPSRLATASDYSQPSYIIETVAKGFTASYYREFRLTFGQDDLSNSKTYVLSYKPYSGGIFTLGRATDNIYFPEQLDEVVLYPQLRVDTWYKFKIAKYKSGLMQVYVDRGSGYGTVPLLEAIDATYTRLGHVSWQTYTETFAEPFYVDWITAVQPSVEKSKREKPPADDLITQVSAKSGKAYTVAKLAAGVRVFTDRSYTITSIPPYLTGASFIKTANDDKQNTDAVFLTSFLKKASIVYIGYDPRAKTLPAWLSGWNKTGDRIETTDPGTPYLEVYSRLVDYGEIYPYPLLLGGNLASPASGAQMNYIVAAVPQPQLSPLEAEAAFLSGAVVANDHAGYTGAGFADYKNLSNDYIEWTVNIAVPGSYNLGFTFANGSATGRTLQIKDNGTTLDTLQFISTQSWASWYFLSGTNVFLSRGIHKIRATAIGLSGPNIDQLSLYYNGSGAANSNVEQGRHVKEVVTQLPEASGIAYPNPFTQGTTIRYCVAEKAYVNLVVYSASGQPVRLLANEIKDAGNYQETLNGNRLAAGTYFYRLQIGKQVLVGRLVKQ